MIGDTKLCARKLLLLCSDLTQTELSAHAKPHKNNKLMNTTVSYYPYVGICTAFNVELNVSDQI